MALVDVHTHAIPARLPDLAARFPEGTWPSVEQTADDRGRILLGGQHYRDIDDRCWSAQRRLADMAAEGVSAQVVSPIPVTFCHDEPADGAAVLARAQNDFFAELTTSAPGRLHALGAVPLQDPDAAAREVARCVDELGFLGVEIGTRVGEVELADPALDPFFDAAAARDALVLIHPPTAPWTNGWLLSASCSAPACPPRPPSLRRACSAATPWTAAPG